MTVKETIEKDGVGMRWLRTAATTITAVGAAAGMVWGAFVYLVEPRAIEWTSEIAKEATDDVRRALSESLSTVERLERVVVELEQNVQAVRHQRQQDVSPSWRFSAPDTAISDGFIGGTVTIDAAGFKLRDCGVPRVDLYFINGGGVYHRFSEPTALDDLNRGIALAPAPDRLQHIRYTAVIPADDNVAPGRAQGFISVTYPDACPAVEPAVAGPLQFRILAGL